MIVDGVAKLTTVHSPSKEAILSLLGPGDSLGMPLSAREMYPDGLRMVRAEAFTACEVIRLSSRSLWRSLEESGEARLEMTELLERELVRYQEIMRRLWPRKTETRLANLLLSLYRGFGEICPDGRRTIEFALTHEQLAQMIVSTREGTSSTLSAFNREGKVSVRSRRFILHDLEQLKSVAHV